MKVYFCPLDAKDNVYTGYDPVAFVKDDEPAQLSQEQERLAIRMKREYLTRLARLQDEIAKKYETAVEALASFTFPTEKAYGKALNSADYERAEKAAKNEFPGHEADYYT